MLRGLESSASLEWCSAHTALPGKPQSLDLGECSSFTACTGTGEEHRGVGKVKDQLMGFKSEAVVTGVGVELS